MLYSEVWREPATTVADRYGISSVALGKICRQLRVPVPGRGYWAQRMFGKEPPTPALPSVHERDQKRITRRKRVLDPVRVAKSTAIGRAAMGPPIVVPHKLTSHHPLIATAAKTLSHAELKNGLSCPPTDCVDVLVSPEARPRALCVLNALILALEERGFSVEVAGVASRAKWLADESVTGMRVLVTGEWIRFQIVEELVQSLPPATKKPPRSLRGAELELWKHWNRPRVQLVPTGRLILRIRERTGLRTSWRDARRPIEDKLNAFIKQLFIIADAKMQAREATDRWRETFQERQLRSERKLAREERRERRNAFVDDQLRRWRDARDLRTLVAEVRARVVATFGTSEPQWLRWAVRRADEIDPVG